MYLDDPSPLVAVLAALAQPGGTISIVAKSPASMVVRPALAGDWAGALAGFEADRQVNGLGVDTRADSVEALTALLEAVGVEAVAWYGVRLFTDGWAPDRPPEDAEPLLLAVELEASRRDPYRGLSRMFHLVGMRHP